MIQTQHDGRYRHGRYGIHAEAPGVDRIRAFIESGEFLTAPLERISTRNAMHDVYTLSLAGMSAPMIMKVARAPDRGGWWRRVETAISLWTRNRAMRSLRHASCLVKATAHMPTPLAAWSYRKGLTLRQYYLCEQVVGGHTFRQYLDTAALQTTIPPDQMVARVAVMLRRIHELGFWHRDPAPNNILIKPDPDHPADVHLFMIDHDALFRIPWHVRAGLIDNPLWRLWSCKRLLRQLTEDQHLRFVEAYLGSECPRSLHGALTHIRQTARESPGGWLWLGLQSLRVPSRPDFPLPVLVAYCWPAFL